MVELREDGTIPGPPEWGQIYRVVNQATGEVGYNYWSYDRKEGQDWLIKQIPTYSTFDGWVTDVIPYDEVKEKAKELNRTPRKFVETAHTRFQARVARRIAEDEPGEIDGFTVRQDFELLIDTLKKARNDAKYLDGWK